ncbi:hypothetical protein [Micromonospora sp. NPDC005171]|uniref:hypothetical protein n=1 Tax=Micromonospora sp. NPDC005171 TaxID=3156866 RepID=UPI0033AC5A5D
MLGIEKVYPHCPRALLRGGAWKPADAPPTSAEVTPAQLRMPTLTIADIEQVGGRTR